MKQYKLINADTKEETICTKIELNGIDYYINDDNILINDYYISFETNYATEPKERFVLYNLCSATNGLNPKKVIATNNSCISKHKLVNEGEELANSIYRDNPTDLKNVDYKYNTDIHATKKRKAFIKGYGQSQETHPFSEKDIINFAIFCSDNHSLDDSDKNDIKWDPIFKDGKKQTSKELLELWKEQQIKTIYYE